MFERYTEKARRTIFSARWEASNYGSSTIETEHLLLGILHEDKGLASRLSLTAQTIRNEVAKRTPPPKQPTPTSVDIPLSHESKRVLAYGAEEAELLTSRVIDVEHLILGLLRESDSFAARLLRQHGVEYDAYRKSFTDSAIKEHKERLVRRGFTTDAESLTLREQIETREPSAAIQAPIAKLENLLNYTVKLDRYSEQDAMQALKRKSWPRKEALGHLADWAMSHQGWFARALTEPKLNTPCYPAEQWAAAQQYSALPWQEIVDLWVCVNRLLIHVLRCIPEEKLNMPCRIGIADPIALSTLIDRYVEHCEDVLEQILARR
jgi:hypothetical protein